MSATAHTAVAAVPAHTATEVALASVRKQAPVIDRMLARFGNVPIADYLREALPVTAQSFQPRDDLLQVVEDYVRPLLGAGPAAAARKSLAAFPLVLTANHHGVDYFAQSVQGSLILSLLGAAQGAPGRTALVFACGGVPLDNFTYPMGLQIYGATALDALPVRVPVFSNRYRRELVSAVGPLDAAMAERAKQRCRAMMDKGEISESLRESLDEILTIYAASDVIGLPDYSGQSVVLNHRLWQRLFASGDDQPQLVVLELEKIARALLTLDMDDGNSLVSCVHFDAQLRRLIMNALDGERTCWSSELLAARLRSPESATEATGSGTFLYWGITERGRRVPLSLDERAGWPSLRGADDRGQIMEFALNPDAIKENLTAGKLLPSLFTCFLAVSFARGINCAGAYYQAEYLPAMRQGVVAALRSAAGYERAAQCVAAVPADSYLAGMQTVMRRHGKKALIPAGPVEIIAGGGLTAEELTKILSMSVLDAHKASLIETASDLTPQQAKSLAWRKRIAADCGAALAGSAVIK